MFIGTLYGWEKGVKGKSISTSLPVRVVQSMDRGVSGDPGDSEPKMAGREGG